jgi:hypothetical protein
VCHGVDRVEDCICRRDKRAEPSLKFGDRHGTLAGRIRVGLAVHSTGAGWYRRSPADLIRPATREALLFQLTAVARPWTRERVFVPPKLTLMVASGIGRAGGKPP